jgi:hypothetical protein
MSATATTFTTGEASRVLGVPEWRLTSLYKRGLLAEPRRFGPYRVLTEEDVEQARLALVRLGVLPSPEHESHAEGKPLPSEDNP